MKVKAWKKVFHENSNEKKTGEATLSDNIGFIKNCSNEQRRRFYIDKCRLINIDYIDKYKLFYNMYQL